MVRAISCKVLFFLSTTPFCCGVLGQEKSWDMPILNKTPYELWKNKKPNISYFHHFGCICYVLNTKEHLGKFDSKAEKCILLGYSECSKRYSIFNKATLVVEESIHVRFDDKL